MPAITMPSITLLFAAAAALINLWLAVRVLQMRMKTKTMTGHGAPDDLLFARGRAHANFNEYVPLALILMALIEMRVGHSTALWALGVLLTVARLLHPLGMDRTPGPMRFAGAVATMLVMLILAVWGVYIAFQPGATITYF